MRLVLTTTCADVLVAQTHEGVRLMLQYAVAFFIVALIAAFFGFGGLAASAASIGKLLFVGFLVLAVVTGVLHLVSRGRKLP